MGACYETKVVVGWKLDLGRVLDFLIQNQVGSCGCRYVKNAKTSLVQMVRPQDEEEPAKRSKQDEYEEDEYDNHESGATQCLCGTSCWTKLGHLLPKGLEMIVTRPYLEAEQEDKEVYLTFLDKTDTDKGVSLLKLEGLDGVKVEQASKLAEKLGADIGTGDPFVLAVLHVCL